MEKPRAPGRCPVCGEEFTITRLHCDTCDTGMDGSFRTCRFCRLTPEQLEFLEAFLSSRGVIKEVEKALGVSYPTVKGRLEDLLAALGYRPLVDRDDARIERGPERQRVLDALEEGSMTVADALKQLKKV